MQLLVKVHFKMYVWGGRYVNLLYILEEEANNLIVAMCWCNMYIIWLKEIKKFFKKYIRFTLVK